MTKKLFSIDISHREGKTIVSWWRHDKKESSGCFERMLEVKTEATYGRLYSHLPPDNISCTFIHPEPDSLSISWLLKE
jgi:hypothetical protein